MPIPDILLALENRLVLSFIPKDRLIGELCRLLECAAVPDTGESLYITITEKGFQVEYSRYYTRHASIQNIWEIVKFVRKNFEEINITDDPFGLVPVESLLMKKLFGI
jgi:hypothetical protein